jgi:hypothetical protein
MFLMDYDVSKGWFNPRIEPYGPLAIDPAAMSLHYGQEIFEGLKAYGIADGGISFSGPTKILNGSIVRQPASACPRWISPRPWKA